MSTLKDMTVGAALAAELLLGTPVPDEVSQLGQSQSNTTHSYETQAAEPSNAPESSDTAPPPEAKQ